MVEIKLRRAGVDITAKNSDVPYVPTPFLPDLVPREKKSGKNIGRTR
jgi:hypothetical protein